MIKIAYVHNLPLEYYPPASNFLDLMAHRGGMQVHAFTTANRKDRVAYSNTSVTISRGRSPDPGSMPLLRLLVALWWHMQTAVSLWSLRPAAIFYVEPHSAIGVWIYFKILRGKARLFIHHHEYYEAVDYERPGMRIPRLGFKLEQGYLFPRAEWISQTNEDRLRLAKKDNPKVPDESWHILPNYPPKAWASASASARQESEKGRTRLIYVGSASFEDTYIKEITCWAASHPDEIELHICGYNVASDIWAWLETEPFFNVSFDRDGYEYRELPQILGNYDVGLVLYKGNTTNFVFNVPNKVFEYLACGLEVWYPREMVSIREFQKNNPAPLREMKYSELQETHPGLFRGKEREGTARTQFTAEDAFAPLIASLGSEL